MKILFFGDSITDMGRDRSDIADEPFKYGSGYVRIIASELFKRNVEKYDILNKGIGGKTSERSEIHDTIKICRR